MESKKRREIGVLTNGVTKKRVITITGDINTCMVLFNEGVLTPPRRRVEVVVGVKEKGRKGWVLFFFCFLLLCVILLWSFLFVWVCRGGVGS